MKLADIINPNIGPACERIYSLISSGSLVIQPQEISVYGTRILFTGNPVPKTSVAGGVITMTWSDGARIDVSSLPDRLDPSVRQVEIHKDKIVVVTGYGRVILRS